MTTAPTPPTQRAGSDSLQGFRDEQHLVKLSVLYWVLAGLSLMFSCLVAIYMCVGAGMLLMHADSIGADPNGPPAWVIPLVGWALAAMGVLAGLIQLGVAVLLALTARFIATRRYRIFCLVVAGLACLSVPLGTALGVYTFMILRRPGVIAWFGGRTTPAIGR